MPKKKWQTPKLIVLVRGRREAGEYVLSACKAEGYGGGAPEFYFRGCWYESLPETCAQCSTVFPSST